MESLNYKYLFACLSGVLISIWGVYLYNSPTYCVGEPKSSCRFLAERGVPVEYGYRPYGVILFIVGIVFTYRVYRISQNEKP